MQHQTTIAEKIKLILSRSTIGASSIDKHTKAKMLSHPNILLSSSLAMTTGLTQGGGSGGAGAQVGTSQKHISSHHHLFNLLRELNQQPWKIQQYYHNQQQ
jgi:hypothetical protein